MGILAKIKTNLFSNPQGIVIFLITIFAVLNVLFKNSSKALMALIKLTFYAFWFFSLINIVYLRFFIEKKRINKELTAKEYIYRLFFKDIYKKANIRKLIIDMVLLSAIFVVVLESYLLINFEVFIFVSVLIIFLIGDTTFSYMRKKLEFNHVNAYYIRPLALVVIIFVSILPLNKNFGYDLSDAIDHKIFSQIAAFSGDNYLDLLKKKLKEEGQDKPFEDYYDEYTRNFEAYLYRLKNNRLKPEVYPYVELLENKTIHSILTDSTFDTIRNKIRDQNKIKILEIFLEYIYSICQHERSVYLKKINSADNRHPINAVFLEMMIDIIKKENLQNYNSLIEKLTNLNKCLIQRTNINSNVLIDFLGNKKPKK